VQGSSGKNTLFYGKIEDFTTCCLLPTVPRWVKIKIRVPEHVGILYIYCVFSGFFGKDSNGPINKILFSIKSENHIKDCSGHHIQIQFLRIVVIGCTIIILIVLVINTLWRSWTSSRKIVIIGYTIVLIITTGFRLSALTPTYRSPPAAPWMPVMAMRSCRSRTKTNVLSRGELNYIRLWWKRWILSTTAAVITKNLGYKMTRSINIATHRAVQQQSHQQRSIYTHIMSYVSLAVIGFGFFDGDRVTASDIRRDVRLRGLCELGFGCSAIVVWARGRL